MVEQVFDVRMSGGPPCSTRERVAIYDGDGTKDEEYQAPLQVHGSFPHSGLRRRG